MENKLVVQFEKLPVYYYKTDYIIYCKACKSYHLNNQKGCWKCGRVNGFTKLDAIAKKQVERRFYTGIGVILIGCSILFLLSSTSWGLIGVGLYSFLCLVLYGLIYRSFKEDFVLGEFEKYLTVNKDKIKADLNEIFQKTQDDVEGKNYLVAYENLRYLGMLIDRPQLRFYKICCLRHFRLRKDMPLEMKELLIKECNRYLIYYIYEVAMLKKELIDESVIKYILQYKKQVLSLEEGEKIIAQVIMAALKSRALTRKYAAFIYEYIDYFPKERLVRLYHIKDCITDTSLQQQIIDKITLKQGYDETS